MQSTPVHISVCPTVVFPGNTVAHSRVSLRDQRLLPRLPQLVCRTFASFPKGKNRIAEEASCGFEHPKGGKCHEHSRNRATVTGSWSSQHVNGKICSATRISLDCNWVVCSGTFRRRLPDHAFGP